MIAFLLFKSLILWLNYIVMNKKDLILGLKAQVKTEEDNRRALTANIDKRIQSFHDAIAALESDDDTINITISKSGLISESNRMTLKDAVKYVVLNDLEKFEPANVIAHKVSGYLPKKKFQEIQDAVSGLLGFWKKDGSIAKYQWGKAFKDTVWGKKEWLDETGNPIQGYFVNPKAMDVINLMKEKSPELSLQG
jgi:hypothetical protein